MTRSIQALTALLHAYNSSNTGAAGMNVQLKNDAVLFKKDVAWGGVGNNIWKCGSGAVHSKRVALICMASQG